MSCACDCASCTEFCYCQRCSEPENDLLQAPGNRPGLDSIHSRIGDYGAFFTDAIRQLSSRTSPNLQALGTRDPTDPTTALLDAWSVTADVLTFYRERLTQESYLRTATDEFSLRELANLVGFKPRPGIAATAHLAYLLDPSAKPVDIDAGAKVQTVPGPGEKMQTFETDEKLSARAEWSQMKSRQTRPPYIDVFYALTQTTIRLTDTSLGVRPGERVLFVFEPNLTPPVNSMGWTVPERVVREVFSAKANFESGVLEITLKPKDGFADKDNITENEILVEQLLGIQSKIDGNTDSSVKDIKKFLLDIISSYFLGMDATGVLLLLNPEQALKFFPSLRDLPGDMPFAKEIEKLKKIFEVISKSKMPKTEELKATSIDNTLSAIRNSGRGNFQANGFQLQQANDGLGSKWGCAHRVGTSHVPGFSRFFGSGLGSYPSKLNTQINPVCISA